MISLSARYAVAALVRLAAETGGTVLNADLAKAAGVPPDYLSKIMQILRRNGFVRTRRGRGGGLTLDRKSEDVTLYDIVRVIDGESAFELCMMADRTCDGSRRCALHGRWSPVRDNMIEFFRSTTLADAVASQQ